MSVKKVKIGDIINIIDEYCSTIETNGKEAILSGNTKGDIETSALKFAIASKISNDLKWVIQSKLGELDG